MHRIVAAGHMAQPHGGVEYSGVSGDPNIHHHSGYLLAAQGMEVAMSPLPEVTIRGTQADGTVTRDRNLATVVGYWTLISARRRPKP
jgi:hypothetical protein